MERARSCSPLCRHSRPSRASRFRFFSLRASAISAISAVSALKAVTLFSVTPCLRGQPGSICQSRKDLFESGQSSNSLSDDQSMDVMRAHVRVDTLEVRHMTHGGIFGENAVCTKQAPRFARNIRRDADVVSLGERNLLRCKLARILEPTDMQ